MAQTSWITDKQFESLVIDYLKEKTNILNDIRCYHLVKYDDENKESEESKLQKKGVDLLYRPLKQEGVYKQGYCDVKSVCCTSLKTFSFELRGREDTNQVGWFINDDLLTDSYLLTYHKLVNGTNNYAIDKSSFNKEMVEKTEAYWIMKDRLKDEIEKRLPNGRTFETILRDIKKDVKNRDVNATNTYYLCKNGKLEFISSYKHSKNKKEDKEPIFYFVYSGKCKERPINIIIKRDFLSLVATKYWEISHIKKIDIEHDDYKEINSILNKYGLSCENGFLNIKERLV